MPTPKFQDWPQDGKSYEASEIVRMYKAGFIGAKNDPAAKERLLSEVGWPDATKACYDFGIVGSGEGKLTLLFTHTESLFPGHSPGPAQQRGDCVSHGEKNACLDTICCEIVSGLPDQQTGKIEGKPNVPSSGISQGVFSTEWFYWHRGYNGDGWSCAASARVARTYGVMVRQAYPELGIDLTTYSGRLAGKYGSQSPPTNMQQVGQQHTIREITNVNGIEQLSDLMANGYGMNSCGGEGFSSTRDENGVSSRRGSWAHSMAYRGCDRRAEVKSHYKTAGLVLVQNSWGKFNSGPRRIMGTNIDIPEGSFWARWEDIARRDVYAHSGANGWPAQKLPNYGYDPSVWG